MEDLSSKFRDQNPDKEKLKFTIEEDSKKYLEMPLNFQLNNIGSDECLNVFCRSTMTSWRDEKTIFIARHPTDEKVINSQELKIKKFKEELFRAAHGDIKTRHEFKKSGWQIYLIKKYIDDPDPEIKALCKDIIDEWKQDQEAP